MSLISDALKRAEEQRLNPSLANPSVSNAADWHVTSSASIAARGESKRTPSSSLFFLNVVALVAVFAFALYFFRAGPQPIDQGTIQRAGGSSEPSTTSVVGSAVSIPSEPSSGLQTQPIATQPAQRTAPDHSLVPTAIVATPPTTSDYELGGTSGVGSTTLLSIVRRDDKRSLWVPVGKTVAEVTAVSYDPEADHAVIRVRGNLLTVVTRDASGNSAPAVKPAE